MFDVLSLSMLQHYWWIIISLVAGILVFLLFVQGCQTLIFSIAKTEIEQTLLINSLGRKWEFTFTTLVVFGGGFFDLENDFWRNSMADRKRGDNGRLQTHTAR